MDALYTRGKKMAQNLNILFIGPVIVGDDIIKSTYSFESGKIYLQTGFAFKNTDCAPFIQMKFKDKFRELFIWWLFE